MGDLSSTRRFLRSVENRNSDKQFPTVDASCFRSRYPSQSHNDGEETEQVRCDIYTYHGGAQADLIVDDPPMVLVL